MVSVIPEASCIIKYVNASVSQSVSLVAQELTDIRIPYTPITGFTPKFGVLYNTQSAPTGFVPLSIPISMNGDTIVLRLFNCTSSAITIPTTTIFRIALFGV